jgi:aminopeptidase N
MPTYLLAFVVSDLKSTSLPLPGTQQRVFARPEHVDNYFTLPGFIFSTEFLGLLEKTFSFKYDSTIKKLDSVAVPDHGSAMENW